MSLNLSHFQNIPKTVDSQIFDIISMDIVNLHSCRRLLLLLYMLVIGKTLFEVLPALSTNKIVYET